MKTRFPLLLILIVTINSCALDKLFLVPYPLTAESELSSYVEEMRDTLTLSFVDGNVPLIHTSKNQVADLPYSITRHVYEGSSENAIYSWCFKPNEDYNGTTIYFLHGNAGNVAYQYAFVTPFVKAGYQVFLIDYSGFGFSEGKAKRKNVIKDANDGLLYVTNHSDIKYDKLIIYGQSLGGHLAAVVANQNQDVIDGVVLEGAFSSHKDIASDQVPLLGRIFVREMYSAEKNIPFIKKPTLIIHSTEDETINYKHGIRLYNLATEPKSLYTIDKPHIRGPIYYADSIVFKMKKMVE